MSEKSPSLPEKPHFRITDKQLDDFVDKGWSYNDAYTHFGVTPDEVGSEDDQLPSEALPMIISSEDAAQLSVADNLAASNTSSLDSLKNIKPGPSLSLLGRAKALGTIMDYFNQKNKTEGADFSSDYNGMNQRYGVHTSEVIGNMHSKANTLGAQAFKALDIISNGDSGVAMPVGHDYSGSIQSDLLEDFGPGRAYKGDREKLLTKVFKTAGTTKSKHRK